MKKLMMIVFTCSPGPLQKLGINMMRMILAARLSNICTTVILVQISNANYRNEKLIGLPESNKIAKN